MKKINWKQKTEALREKLREDPAQTRALSHVVKFFLLMLLLTLIARGASGAILARVELCTPSQQTFSRSLSATGAAEARGHASVTVPGALTAAEVLVQPGSVVAAGDTLAVFEAGSVEAAITRKTAQRQQLLVQLEALEDPQTVSDQGVTSAQRELSRAKEALAKAKESLSAAGSSAEAAQAELRRAEEALSQAAPDEVEAAQAALQAAQARAQEAEAVYSAASDALEGAELQAQDAAERLEQAEEAYAQAQKQAGRTDESNAASARLLQLDIEALEEELLSLTGLQAADCRLTAPAGGIVREVPLAQGGATGGGERITMDTEEAGYLLTFQTTQAEAEALQTGEKILMVSQNTLWEKVSEFQAVETDAGAQTVTFTALLTTPGWTGDPVFISAELSQDSYGTGVPVSAIHRDGDGAYVYVFRSRLTILGLQNVAERVNVTVEDSYGGYAAIQGDISRDDSLISGSSKPLSDGDRVRVRP